MNGLRKACFMLLAMLGIGTALVLAEAQDSIALSPPPLTYQIHVTTAAGLEVTRTALFELPSLVDVNGDGHFDISVQLGLHLPPPLDGRTALDLTILKLPLASPPPSKVEVIVANPAGGFAHFGFDARNSTIPDRFATTATIAGSPLYVNLSATVNGPGASLAITGGTYDQMGSPPLNQRDVLMGYAPVPARLGISVCQANSDPANANPFHCLSNTANAASSDHFHIDLSAESATTLTGGITDASQGLRVAATLDQLPACYTSGGCLGVDYFTGSGTSPGDPRKIVYVGTTPVNRAVVQIAQNSPTTASSDLVARLTGVPATSITVNQDGSTHATIDSGGVPIGQSELDVASPGPAQPLLQPGDGMSIIAAANPQATSVSARLTGLTTADVNWGDPIEVVNLGHASGPFTITAVSGTAASALSAVATVTDLPAKLIDLRYSPSAGTIHYQGGAVIDQIAADVTATGSGSAGLLPPGKSPFSGPITQAHALIQKVPTSFDVTYEPSVTLDAPAADPASSIAVELRGGGSRLSDEPAVTDADTAQRALFKNLPDRWVSFARVVGLTHIDVSLSPNVHLGLTHTAGPFSVHVVTGTATNGLSASAIATPLPGTVDLTYAPNDGFIHYQGNAVIDQISADVINTGSNPVGLIPAPGAPFTQACPQGTMPPPGTGSDCPAPITEAHILLKSVPNTLSLAYRPGISFAVPTGTVGELALELRGGAARAADEPSVDDPDISQRVLFKDLSDRWVTFARVIGLSKLDELSLQPDFRIRGLTHTAGQFTATAVTATASAPPPPAPPPPFPCPPLGFPCFQPPPPTPAPAGGAGFVTATVVVSDLPATVNQVSYSKGSQTNPVQTMVYDGSDTVAQVSADVLAPGGLFDPRVNEIHALVTGLPKTLAVNLSTSGRTSINVDAHGAVIGSVQFQVLSDDHLTLDSQCGGPGCSNSRPATTNDVVFLRDVTATTSDLPAPHEHLAAFARLHNLKSLSLSLSPKTCLITSKGGGFPETDCTTAAHLDLETGALATPGAQVVADIQTMGDSKLQTLVGGLGPLPPSMVVDMAFVDQTLHIPANTLTKAPPFDLGPFPIVTGTYNALGSTLPMTLGLTTNMVSGFDHVVIQPTLNKAASFCINAAIPGEGTTLDSPLGAACSLAKSDSVDGRANFSLSFDSPSPTPVILELCGDAACTPANSVTIDQASIQNLVVEVNISRPSWLNIAHVFGYSLLIDTNNSPLNANIAIHDQGLLNLQLHGFTASRRVIKTDFNPFNSQVSLIESSGQVTCGLGTSIAPHLLWIGEAVLGC